VAWYNCPSHFGNLFTFGDGNKKKRNTRFSFLFNAKRGKYRHAVIGERNDHVLYNDSLFNNWRQIAITFDGLNGKAYVDGIGFGSFKTTFNTSGDLPLIIGSNSLNRNDEFYRGSIDELSIFDRYLNESEIQHSYKSSSTKEYKPAPDVTPPKTGPGDAPDLKCKETIAKLEQEIKDQKIEITDLNILIIELRKQVADLNSSNLALTTEVSGMKNQVNNLNGQVASLTSENGELKGQVTNLREDNGNLQVTVTSLNEQLVEADRIAKTPFVHDWVYTPDHGWLYIDPQNFPIIYKNDTQSWHFYEQGSINPRYFYNFNEQKWEAWDSIPSGSEN
jgi:cell division protein FtsL